MLLRYTVYGCVCMSGIVPSTLTDGSPNARNFLQRTRARSMMPCVYYWKHLVRITRRMHRLCGACAIDAYAIDKDVRDRRAPAAVTAQTRPECAKSACVRACMYACMHAEKRARGVTRMSRTNAFGTHTGLNADKITFVWVVCVRVSFMVWDSLAGKFGL